MTGNQIIDLHIIQRGTFEIAKDDNTNQCWIIRLNRLNSSQNDANQCMIKYK